MDCFRACFPCCFRDSNNNIHDNNENNNSENFNEKDLLMKIKSEKKGRYTNYYLNEEKIDKLQLKNDSYYVKIVDIYDADIVTCILFFRDKPSLVKLRLDGIDTPEMKPDSNDEHLIIKEKALAIIAKIVLYKLINQNDFILLIKTHGSEKYGRTLATLYKDADAAISFNKILIDNPLTADEVANKFFGKLFLIIFKSHFLTIETIKKRKKRNIYC